MCRDCLHEVRPERGRTCFEHGAFLSNFRACTSCGARGVLHERDRNVEETEEPSPVAGDDENDFLCETTFNHVCACGHVVSEHFHRFEATTLAQDTLMSCLLCGEGTDTFRHPPRPLPPASSGVAGSRPLSAATTAASESVAEAQEARETKLQLQLQAPEGVARRAAQAAAEEQAAADAGEHDEWA